MSLGGIAPIDFVVQRIDRVCGCRGVAGQGRSQKQGARIAPTRFPQIFPLHHPGRIPRIGPVKILRRREAAACGMLEPLEDGILGKEVGIRVLRNADGLVDRLLRIGAAVPVRVHHARDGDGCEARETPGGSCERESS